MYDDPFVKHDDSSRRGPLLATSYLSMALNVALAAGKIVAGALAGAVSVVTDGFNNLSDCLGNTITVIGVKASAGPADKEHPYGHARGEYVAAVIFSCLIIFLALELFSLSVENIIAGESPAFSALAAAMLAVGVAVKAAMFLLYRRVGKKYSSQLMIAASLDSIGDVLSSAVVLVSVLASDKVPFCLDGYVGVAVCALIAFSGAKILRRTMSELIGRRPSKDFIAEMERRLLSYDGVYGVHGLSVHNYFSRVYVSVHAEIDASVSVLAAHELIDRIEKDFAENTQIDLTVHIDPVVLHNAEVSRLLAEVEKIVTGLDAAYAVHDFRVIVRAVPTLAFEVCVPFETKPSDADILSALYERLYAEFGTAYTYSADVKREL